MLYSLSFHLRISLSVGTTSADHACLVGLAPLRAGLLFLDSLDRVFGDFPGFSELGDDGADAEIVVDALGEESSTINVFAGGNTGEEEGLRIDETEECPIVPTDSK